MSKLVFETVTSEVLIVGSQGAGTRAAIAATAEGADVAMVTKGRWGKDGATVTGDADLDVDSRSLHELFRFPNADPRDTKDAFFEDMVKAGKYLNQQNLVAIHVDEAPARLAELIEWGLKVDRVVHHSGHRYPRGVSVPGVRVMNALIARAQATPARVFEDTMITHLLAAGRRVVGALGVDWRGRYLVFNAKAVILATGGAMRQYPHTTAPEQLTGDGQVMAFRAGAELIDMEFPMFLPGSFVWPPAVKGVDVPFLLSTAGAFHGHLLNRRGERFMEKWDPENLEHTTRDIASVAMMDEILRGEGGPHGGVYVSLKHLPNNLIRNYIENVKPLILRYGGFDMAEYLPDLGADALESVPASHFFNGGIRIDEGARTTLEGLYAAGEVAGGVHGGNRLSGNAFTEFLVWGKRSGESAAIFAQQTDLVGFDRDQVECFLEELESPLARRAGADIQDMRRRLQNLAWQKVGVIRTAQGLQEALSELKAMKEECTRLVAIHKGRTCNLDWRDALETRNMRDLLELTATAAIAREESRASHYVRDFPMTDYPNWTKNSVLYSTDGRVEMRHVAPKITKYTPPDKKVPYGRTE